MLGMDESHETGSTKQKPVTQSEAEETIGDWLTLLDAVAERAAGPDAALQPLERKVIQRAGARSVRKFNLANRVVDATPVFMLAIFLLLWIWRVMDLRAKQQAAKQPATYTTAPTYSENVSMFTPPGRGMPGSNLATIAALNADGA
jgi:hypothetical protein